MPVYEFSCLSCNTNYDTLTRYDSTGVYASVSCPKCKSVDKKKWMSKPNFSFANPEGTDRWNSDSTGHDYRFHHNLPKVIDERRRAEEASHMGQDPYQEAGVWNDTNKYDVGVHDQEVQGGWLK